MIGVITAIRPNRRIDAYVIVNYEVTIELRHGQKVVLIMSADEITHHAIGQQCNVHVKWA